MRHLITVSDLNYEDINSVFKLADSFTSRPKKGPLRRFLCSRAKQSSFFFRALNENEDKL